MPVHSRKKLFRKLLILLFWLALWQVLSMVVGNPLLLVSPISALGALLRELCKLTFWQTVLMSFMRVGAGFSAGLVVGMLTAVLCHSSALLEELLTPLIHLIRTLPMVSFVVLFLIWWGSSFLSVAVSFLMVFPAIYFSTLEGLKSLSKEMLEMAEVFRLPGITKVICLYRPAIRPFLMGGIRTSLGLAWKSGVAAEVIGLPALSMGEKLYLAKISLDTAGVLAWTAVVVILSACFERFVLSLARRLLFGRVTCSAPRRRNLQGDGLCARHLTKQFGQQTLFQDLSFDLKAGEVRWLIWPSGRGKTTLLRILTGLEKPDQGTTAPQAATLSFGVLFQEDRLWEEETALWNVSLVTGEEERARRLLEELLGPGFPDQPCRLLSGGEKRRVALARALLSDCQCLILDEPFAGLDRECLERVWKVIGRYRCGRTLVIASHILPESDCPREKKAFIE